MLSKHRGARAVPSWLVVGLISLGIAASFAGCGKFGDRQDPNLTVTYAPASIGCLNDIGTKLNQYIAGTVAPADWKSSMDCAVSSIDQFKQFVQPSSPEGFTATDISAFLGKFLLTKFPDNADIVSALLQVKALILGGTTDVLSFADVDRAQSLLVSIRTESLKLLPLVAARAQSSSPTALLQLADGLSDSGGNIAAALAAMPGSRLLSWDDATHVAAAAARVLGWNEPAQLIAVASAAKDILFAGAPNGIEPSLVPTLVQTGATLGGLAMAGLAAPANDPAPNATADFYVQLALRARPTLNAMLDRHAGALPLASLDTLLDALPTAVLPVSAGVVERAMRPLVNTLLRSTTTNAVNSGVLGFLYQLAQDWDASEIHLESIFNQMGSPDDVMPNDFLVAADNYASKQDPADQALITRITNLASNVKPLFKTTDNQITFTAQDRISLGHLQKLLLIRMGAEQLLQSYGTGTGGTFVVSNMEHLLSDYQEIALGLHFLDATVANTASKRFQEADLFTMVSNGDGAIDINEGVYFLADFLSAENFASRIRTLAEVPCGNGTYDSLNWEWMEASCFRNKFFGGYLDLWDHFPHLLYFYNSLSSTDQVAFQKVMEQSTRFYGYSQAPFASYDVGGLAGFMQYMETLFMRFDANGDEMLDLPETLGAYPTFKLTLATLGKQDPSNDAVLQAIMTYILRFAATPVTTFPQVAQFIWWEAWKPFWKITADRKVVYTVMASLTAPPTVAPVPKPEDHGQPAPGPTGKPGTLRLNP